ncbi:unnamed protein product [Camellia sinensis]
MVFKNESPITFGRGTVIRFPAPSPARPPPHFSPEIKLLLYPYVYIYIHIYACLDLGRATSLLREKKGVRGREGRKEGERESRSSTVADLLRREKRAVLLTTSIFSTYSFDDLLRCPSPPTPSPISSSQRRRSLSLSLSLCYTHTYICIHITD